MFPVIWNGPWWARRWNRPKFAPPGTCRRRRPRPRGLGGGDFEELQFGGLEEGRELTRPDSALRILPRRFGLWIVSQIASNAGGEVSLAEPPPGFSTCFEVLLPPEEANVE